MANDILHALIRANLAGAIVALILLAARGLLRRQLGPSAVYALWLAVPAAGLASLLPARTVVTVLHAASFGAAPGAAAPSAANAVSVWPILAVTVWAIGVAAALCALVWRHYRFLASLGRLETADGVLRAATSNAGPAVIGLISPRILVPGDFETRFSSRERGVILAHEGIHLARGDSRINAVVLALQCLSWFNPVAHIAARALRLDQELACDAGVMARFPNARRSYAEAMLKSQTDPITVPAGCYWQAKGASALSHRLALLAAKPLSRSRLAGGVAMAGLLTICAGLVAWSLQPARERIVILSEPARSAVALSGPAGGAAAPRSLPAAPLLHSASFTARPNRAVAPAPKILPPKTQPAPSPVEWSMPMPPDPDQDETYASGSGFVSPNSQTVAQTAISSVQAQTVSYRSGAYQMKADTTTVGDLVQVSAQLFKGGVMVGTGTAVTTPGEMAYVALSNGQFAKVEPGKMAYLITPSTPSTPSAGNAALSPS